MSNELDTNIYERSNNIRNLSIPESVCIIGAGGVGSWVAFFFGQVGVQRLVIIDDDIVEEHNLNRTPFKYDQIGDKKVNALSELIRERRWSDVLAIDQKWEQIPEPTRQQIKENTMVFIDCRDSITPIEDLSDVSFYITGGYDGINATIHVNPNLSNVFGEDTVRYRTTPSYLVPPVMIATTIVNHVCVERRYRGTWYDRYNSQVTNIDFSNWTNLLNAGEEALYQKSRVFSSND